MSGFVLLFKVYTCIVFKQSEAQIFVYYLFFNMGQVKLSMDKYLMAIYLSLGKYKLLLFRHPWCMIYLFSSVYIGDYQNRGVIAVV